MAFEFLKSLLNEHLDEEYVVQTVIKDFSDPTKGSKKFDVITYDKKDWTFTGKKGLHFASHKPSFEYSFRDKQGEHRIWVTIDGEVIDD